MTIKPPRNVKTVYVVARSAMKGSKRPSKSITIHDATPEQVIELLGKAVQERQAATAKA